MSFPECKPEYSHKTLEVMFDLGLQWAKDPNRPKISRAVLATWTNLIDAWAEADDLPLLVRKQQKNRGSLITGAEGRILIPTDNSPAQWAFAYAHSGLCPNLSQITSMLDRGEIPVAMILNKDERDRAKYTGVRRSCLGTSANGWKLAHIKAIGLGGRGGIHTSIPSTVVDHFKLFMSPENMLVVPAKLSGLAEVEDFIKGFCSVS